MIREAIKKILAEKETLVNKDKSNIQNINKEDTKNMEILPKYLKKIKFYIK